MNITWSCILRSLAGSRPLRWCTVRINKTDLYRPPHTVLGAAVSLWRQWNGRMSYGKILLKNAVETFVGQNKTKEIQSWKQLKNHHNKKFFEKIGMDSKIFYIYCVRQKTWFWHLNRMHEGIPGLSDSFTKSLPVSAKPNQLNYYAESPSHKTAPD